MTKTTWDEDDEAFAQHLANFEVLTAESEAIVEQIKPLLAGKISVLQGAVLAEVVAIWVAGHIVPDDTAATAELQAGIMEFQQLNVAHLVKHYNRKREHSDG